MKEDDPSPLQRHVKRRWQMPTSVRGLQPLASCSCSPRRGGSTTEEVNLVQVQPSNKIWTDSDLHCEDHWQNDFLATGTKLWGVGDDFFDQAWGECISSNHCIAKFNQGRRLLSCASRETWLTSFKIFNHLNQACSNRGGPSWRGIWSSNVLFTKENPNREFYRELKKKSIFCLKMLWSLCKHSQNLAHFQQTCTHNLPGCRKDQRKKYHERPNTSRTQLAIRQLTSCPNHTESESAGKQQFLNPTKLEFYPPFVPQKFESPQAHAPFYFTLPHWCHICFVCDACVLVCFACKIFLHSRAILLNFDSNFRAANQPRGGVAFKRLVQDCPAKKQNNFW